MVWGTPKSHQRREVPIPGCLVDDLVRHVDGREPDELVFGGLRNRAPLRVATFRTAFSAAAKAIGVPDLHPHDLRHTAASLAIASGADVKVVQQMLGHGSATMTLDTYGHLFGDRLDEISSALSAAREAKPRSIFVPPRAEPTATMESRRRSSSKVLLPFRCQTRVEPTRTGSP